MRLILFLLCVSTLSSCALVSDLNKIDKTKRDRCNYDGAFAAGMEQAKAGHSLNSGDISTYCSGTNLEESQKGFRDGYMTGAKSAK